MALLAWDLRILAAPGSVWSSYENREPMAPPSNTMSYRESIGRLNEALYWFNPPRTRWSNVGGPPPRADGASRSR